MDTSEFERKLMEYNRAHWGADNLPPEWREYDFETALSQVMIDFTADATKNRKFYRIAGQSGTGKTTQLLPAVTAYYEAQNAKPILIAARLFVDYHPYKDQILERFGIENIRESTNEFSVCLMFLSLKALISEGWDIILDVTLLDPFIEGILMQLLTAYGYDSRIAMMAVSKEISDSFIGKRVDRKVRTSTAAEFWRATAAALDFYVENFPNTRISVWSAFKLKPVYDGPVVGSLAAIREYQQITKMPTKAPSEDKLREAKIQYLRTSAK